MKDKTAISIVVAIRDWDPERLEIAIRSYLDSTMASQIEIVVSDFGSIDGSKNKEICDRYGCRYLYTDSHVWSRSRALNAGLSHASSDIMLTSDADIIIAPRTFEAVVSFLQRRKRAVVLAQCMNLDEDYELSEVGRLDWSEIHDKATLRPRWGMGGLCAFTRETLDALRGFDDRMVIWGAEDNDFVKRCRGAGRFVHWISGPAIGIYHVWHPPFMQTDPNADEIFAKNRALLDHDHTIARNYLGDTFYHSERPLVSIHIASFNRAHLLRDTIQSVLTQTIDRFELLIYDDGSTDNTEEVVKSFEDRRIRYFKGSGNQGVAFARNTLLDHSRGEFSCVHDDDDIMLPNRLEVQLNAMVEGAAGAYGGWINFDSTTGDMDRNPGKAPFGVPAIAFVKSILLHPTLLLRTEVLRRMRYETNFKGGSDYNLVFRMAHAGLRLVHCGHYVILRRVHAESLTGSASRSQKNSALLTIAPFLNALSSHVERQLRIEAKGVTEVPAELIYSSEEVRDLLPAELFDSATEVDWDELQLGDAKVLVFDQEAGMRCFLWNHEGEMPESCSEVGPTRVQIRVPRASGIDLQEESERLERIATTVLFDGNSASDMFHDYSALEGASLEELRRAIELHGACVRGVVVVADAGLQRILVCAESDSLARLVSHRLASMVEEGVETSLGGIEKLSYNMEAA